MMSGYECLFATKNCNELNHHCNAHTKRGLTAQLYVSMICICTECTRVYKQTTSCPQKTILGRVVIITIPMRTSLDKLHGQYNSSKNTDAVRRIRDIPIVSAMQPSYCHSTCHVRTVLRSTVDNMASRFLVTLLNT